MPIKAQANCTVNPQLKEDFFAKYGKGSLSGMVEDMMRKALKRDINSEEKFCHRCGRDDKSMIWDGYYNDWICEPCNHAEIKSLKIVGKSNRTEKGND